jgi:hypothetical protein
MKKILLSATALTLLFASCKKDDDKGTSENFVVGSTTYPVVDGGVINGPTLLATSGDLNNISSFTVMFNGTAAPTASGSYKVVAGLPGANEISVNTMISNGASSYISTGHDNVSAAVTVNGGKVSINLPKTWAVKPGGGDSVQVSATFSAD